VLKAEPIRLVGQLHRLRTPLLVAWRIRLKGKRIAVLYRENCGGILRHLASGFRKSAKTIAEIDMYEDLRERLFKQSSEKRMEQEQMEQVGQPEKLSA
jgi:hypothetical protein